MSLNPTGRAGAYSRAGNEPAAANADPMFVVYHSSGSPRAQSINVLLEDHSGVLWYGTDEGLYRLAKAGNAWTPEAVEIGLAHETADDTHINSLVEDHNGSLWIGTMNGLYRRGSDGVVERYTTQQELPANNVRALLEDRSGQLWAGTSLGLVLLVAHPDRGHTIVARAYSAPNVAALFQTSNGKLLVNSNGLCELDLSAPVESRELRCYAKATGLSDSIQAFTEDRADNLWIGTTSEGVMKLARNGFTSYSEADGLGGPRIASIFENRAGELCVIAGNPISPINRFDGKTFKLTGVRQPPGEGHSWGWYQVAFQDRAGDWWIPTADGLYRYAAAQSPLSLAAKPKAIYTTADGLAGDHVFRLYEDSHGDIWIGSISPKRDTLSRWDRATDTIHHFTQQADRLPPIAPTAFREDAKGNIWIGYYDGGLARYHEGRFTIYSATDGVPEGQVRGLTLDHLGRLWVATTQGGLGRIDDPTSEHPHFAILTTADGLSSNQITSLTEDRQGQLYVGTGRGVDELDPSTGHIKHFSTADGLPNDYINVSFTDHLGSLWFGTLRGLASMAMLIATMFLLTVVAQAAVYTVTTTNDSGAGSLRKAIADANNQAGKDFIFFNIPGSGVHTITLLTPLEVISGPIDIDGYTQPGASANTLAQADNAVLLIEITTLNGAAPSVFDIAAPSTIHGLALNRAAQYGIYIRSAGGGSTITGNFIGTDAAGVTARSNGVGGIYVEGSNNNLIGGSVPSARNIISGNTSLGNNGAGVFVSGVASSNNKIQGNFIGVNKNGSAAFSNHQAGVWLETQANNNTVGGTTVGERNIISGNTGQGVFVFNANFNLIEGNYIGTDASGNFSVANSDGIDINSDSFFNKVGDTVAGAGNVISGNAYDGIDLIGNNGKNPHVNQLLGNFIGTKADGTSPLGNGTDGVRISSGAFNNIIGTKAAGAGNVIAFSGANPTFNNGSGVFVLSDGTGNLISGNSIYSNTTLGIDLVGTSGVTPNDTDDSDSGPNDLQNYPDIINATYSAATGTQITYLLQSKANKKYTVEIFASNQCNASDYGEGQNFIGSLDSTTNASGSASTVVGFSAVLLNKYITVTATDPSGNTSEFSRCMQVTAPPPGSFSFSIANYSVNENVGTANITVQRTGGSSGAASVQYATVAGGTAAAGSDYTSTNGTLNWQDGDNVDRTFTVAITDDAVHEPDKTIHLALSNPQGGATLGNQSTATLTILDDDAVAAPAIQFSSATYSVQEDLTAVTVTVTRSGDSSGSATVDYATSDGSASQKSDYEVASGTVTFGSGDTSKSFQVLINEDSYVEGTETVNLTLSNPTGVSLGAQSTAVLSITDDAMESVTNPIDDPQSFVHMHYHDFLNREPDQAGLQFWTTEFANCGQDAACINDKRVNVSAAYFLSIEFQQTGYLLYLFQKESFGSLEKYRAFMRDLQEISQGVVVNSPGWEQKLATNQQQFAEKWVSRSSFKAAYDGLSNAAYVNALYANAGVVPPQAERDGLVTKLDTASESRAAALLDVATNAAFRQQEQNSAFVLMQYFGYLRRDPDSGPDSDLSGYYFWLGKLNAFNGDYQQAEMVKSFLVSSEYRSRFGQQ